KSQERDGTNMPLDLADFLGGIQVPDMDDSVNSARREQLAVRTDGKRQGADGFSGEYLLFSRTVEKRDPPCLNRAIAGDELLVGGDGEGVHIRIRALGLAALLTGRGIPLVDAV